MACPLYKTTFFTLILVGCSTPKEPTSEDADTADVAPGPWEGLDIVPLDSARVLLSPSIDDAVNPTELIMFPDRALAFVLDTEAERVHVLDERYGHDGRAYCIDMTQVSRSTAKGSAVHCPEGRSEVQRGALVPDDRPLAMALDTIGHTAAVLSRSGVLYHGAADIIEDDPATFLSLGPGQLISPLDLPVSAGHIAAHDGVVSIAEGELLVIIEADDVHTSVLPGAALDLAMDGMELWVATAAGVWSESRTVDAVGEQLVHWQGAWWLVQTTEEQVLRLSDLETVAVGSITGPAAADPRTDVLHLATSTGFVRVSTDGSLESVATEAPVIDLDINLAGETVLLHSGGALTVLVDETAYDAATPLDVFITTFSERPRNPEDDVPCRGEAPSIEAFMDNSLGNRDWLDDVPAPVGMGITPTLVAYADDCEVREQLVQLMDHPLTSSGILVHEEPSDCVADRACHTAFLAGMLAEFGDDLRPSWTSGMSTHHELNLNWVASLQDAGLPSRYLFYGMSHLPDIPHHNDVRAKDSWPVTLGDQARAWGADSGTAVAERDGAGSLSIYTGDNTPAFNLGGCSNLFLLECHPLLRGGGTVIDADDVAVLDLLLHRALTQEVPATVRTWSFHLPNIGDYDYASDCSKTERIWSGDDCAAARLQEWLFDVDRRLVAAGLVRWTRPGDLVAP
jgi:hypothetical protein